MKAVPVDRPADGALVDQPARPPSGSAEEGVGGRAQQQTALCRFGNQPAAIGGRGRQRLFGEDVLARGKRRKRNVEMRRRYRQVEDKVDVRVGQQRVDAERADAIFLGAESSHVGGDVGTGAQLDPAEQGRIAQIGHRDVAASDDTDAQLYR